MIPVKIITKEIAKKLGLTENKNQPSGGGMIGGGAVVVENKKTGKKKVLETYIIKQNGKKELTFMSKKRVQYLKSKKDYTKYLKQFNKVKGIQK